MGEHRAQLMLLLDQTFPFAATLTPPTLISAGRKDGVGNRFHSLSALQEAEGREERTSICSYSFKCRQRSAIL